jgi:hypothetical protein
MLGAVEMSHPCSLDSCFNIMGGNTRIKGFELLDALLLVVIISDLLSET